MGRPRNPDLTINWKIPLPATLAGMVELALTDPLTKQPRYGARTKLVTALCEHWLDSVAGKPVDERRPLPTLDELRHF